MNDNNFHRAIGTRHGIRTSAHSSARWLSMIAGVFCFSAALAGDVVGVVSNANLDRFVEGAVVTVQGQNKRTSTDRFGRYVLRDLPAGEAIVEVSAGGFDKFSAPTQVPATGLVTLDINLSSVYESIEEIVVTSSRVSQLLALQRKRSAENILDAVSADTVGKLPDFNAAEAVQRLPGLSVELDQGEGRYPIIRGIDSNLNNVTIDGNSVGAPEGGGRRVALDVVPSDLISVVEVVKAVTPDLDGNAIGGNINIITRSAFDSPDPFAFLSGRIGYNDKSDRVPYGGSAVWGSRLGASENIGVVLAASYYNRRYNTNLIEGGGWAEFSPGNFAPENYKIFDYDIERERIGINANIEYRPTDESLLYIRSIFNEFTDEEQRDQLDLDAARGTQTAVSSTVVQNSQGRASREYRQNDQTQQLTNISLGGELTRGRYEWSGSYTNAHAEEITPRRVDWEYRSSGGAFPNTIDVAQDYFLVDAGTAINDPANYPFRRVRFRTDGIEEDIDTVQADLRIDTEFGQNSGYLKFGVKYGLRDKFRNRENQDYEDASSFTLADNGLFNPGPGDFLDGQHPLGIVLDFQGHTDYFAANPGMFEFDAEGSAENSIATDYSIEEDILAGYAMASVNVGVWAFTGGVRVEQTDASYNAFFIDLPSADPLNPGIPISGATKYTDVLPSLHMTYRPNDNIVVRAAWTNTIGRPNYEDVVPSLEIEDDVGSSGNPELAPFESMGLDLTFEYYFEPSGIFSVGVFYKDIENPVYTRRTENVVINGIPLLSLNRPENADSGSLLGLELNLERQFVGLPHPFDGLGASVNLTLIDSEVNVFGREADNLPFIRQPDTIGNIAVFYAIGSLEARVAMTYRDSYLEGIGGDTLSDIYFDDRTQVDFKLSYEATESLSLFGEIQNINDATRREYQSVSHRLAADELYSWTALFGASYAF